MWRLKTGPICILIYNLQEKGFWRRIYTLMCIGPAFKLTPRPPKRIWDSNLSLPKNSPIFSLPKNSLKLLPFSHPSVDAKTSISISIKYLSNCVSDQNKMCMMITLFSTMPMKKDREKDKRRSWWNEYDDDAMCMMSDPVYNNDNDKCREEDRIRCWWNKYDDDAMWMMMTLPMTNHVYNERQ